MKAIYIALAIFLVSVATVGCTTTPSEPIQYDSKDLPVTDTE